MEQICTIPVNEAFEKVQEEGFCTCPFCLMYNRLEDNELDLILGASMMEPDVRLKTNEAGFCDTHLGLMFSRGKRLPLALMLESHLDAVAKDLEGNMGMFIAKTGDNAAKRLEKLDHSCYICDRIEENMSRYYQTFFTLTKEKEFREKVEGCKGFCVRHFARLLHEAEKHLPDSQRYWFYPTVYKLMCENMERVKEDLDWLVAKYDYRNAGAPWGNSQDALPRTMQKLQGIYPGDPPYKEK
jgi:hypothetical protein